MLQESKQTENACILPAAFKKQKMQEWIIFSSVQAPNKHV